MNRRFLLPLIICLMLVLPGFASGPPKNAPVAERGVIAALLESLGVISIKTAPKDSEEKQAFVDKSGVIEVPQVTVDQATLASGPSSGSGAPSQAATSGATAGKEGADTQTAKESSNLGNSRTSGIPDSTGSLTSNDGQLGDNLPNASNPGGLMGGSASPLSLAGEPLYASSTTPTLPADQLQAMLNNAVSDGGIPGAVLAVKTQWGTWIGVAGTASLSANQAMTTDTQVRLAGVTKPFTAALIMRLIQENKLALTDTVEHWLPGQVIPGGDTTAAQKITVAMLLNHTSGLHDHESTSEFLTRLLANPTLPWSAADVLGITNAYPLDFAPNTAFSYCNTGYYLLGMIAEAATGDTVEHLIQSRFFTPLGLTRTALTRSGQLTAPYAGTYCWFGYPVWDQTSAMLTDTSGWDYSWDWTSGSGVTTAQDMLNWTSAFFGGQVVNGQSLQQMLTPRSPSTSYGFGIEVVNPDSWFGEMMYDHGGTDPGCLARWLYYPNSGRTIFLALNRADQASPPPVDAVQAANTILSNLHTILINSGSQ